MPVGTLRTSALCVLAALVVASTAAALAGRRAAVHSASAADVVHLAEAELAKNVHEVPDGSNNSPDIARYRRATVGAIPGAPWCAYFVSYIAKKAGVPIGYAGHGIGYVPYIRDWARRSGRSRRTPSPGDLITFPEHVGIVEHVYSNHTLTSIEGNYSNRVARVYHSWSDAMSYVQIASPGKIESGAGHKPPPTTTHHRLVARIHVYPSTTVAVGARVDFTSNDSSGNQVKVQWDLTGSGHWNAHGTNVSHVYDQAGVYKVRLRISDGHHHHSSATAKVTVEDASPPQPSFTMSSDSINAGDSVSFDASRSSDPGQIVRYEWDYEGDGNYQDGGAQASHTYSAPGTYTVRLRVTDDRGLTAETEQTLEVASVGTPVAAIDCDTAELYTQHTLHCSSDDSSSPTQIVRHDWDMTGSGSYDHRGHSVSYRYSHAGTYVIHLRVTDENGAVAETTTPIQVDDQPPVARVRGHHSVYANQAVSFDGSRSYDPDGQVVRWEWDDGQGGGYRPGSSSFTTTYGQPGSYTVRLRVTDDSGATSETTYWVNAS